MLRDLGFLLLANFIGLITWVAVMLIVMSVREAMTEGNLPPDLAVLAMKVMGLTILFGGVLALIAMPFMGGALWALRALGWVNPWVFMAVGAAFACLLIQFLPGRRVTWVDYAMMLTALPPGLVAGYCLWRWVR